MMINVTLQNNLWFKFLNKNNLHPPLNAVSLFNGNFQPFIVNNWLLGQVSSSFLLLYSRHQIKNNVLLLLFPGTDGETRGNSCFQRSSGQCRVVVRAAWKTQRVAEEPVHGFAWQWRGLQRSPAHDQSPLWGTSISPLFVFLPSFCYDCVEHALLHMTLPSPCFTVEMDFIS